MGDQLVLPDLNTYDRDRDIPPACGRVCLRLRRRCSIVSLVCVRAAGHDGAHRYVTTERLRSTTDVRVIAAVL